MVFVKRVGLGKYFLKASSIALQGCLGISQLGISSLIGTTAVTELFETSDNSSLRHLSSVSPPQIMVIYHQR